MRAQTRPLTNPCMPCVVADIAPLAQFNAAALESAVVGRLDAAGLAAALAELGGSGSDAADGAGDDEGSVHLAEPDFSEEELAWGRKEAKSRLSADDFRAWRKASKRASKQKAAAT